MATLTVGCLEIKSSFALENHVYMGKRIHFYFGEVFRLHCPVKKAKKSQN